MNIIEQFVFEKDLLFGYDFSRPNIELHLCLLGLNNVKHIPLNILYRKWKKNHFFCKIESIFAAICVKLKWTDGAFFQPILH